MASEQLLIEGRTWLRRVVEIQDQRLTLDQHREVLSLAGWLALLVGCVEYDMGSRTAAESTRQAALSLHEHEALGKDAGDADVVGWAHEMRAWAALTTGDYRGVIAAAHAGTEVAGTQGVAVQLAAQEAKAWARVGDRRQTEVALDRGRHLLEQLEHPTNLDHHFVVDPSKFDFYAMDAYRLLGENRLAETYADEVIRVSTDFDGTERKPMRIAEARVTHGVITAREGDVERAVAQGELALALLRRHGKGVRAAKCEWPQRLPARARSPGLDLVRERDDRTSVRRRSRDDPAAVRIVDYKGQSAGSPVRRRSPQPTVTVRSCSTDFKRDLRLGQAECGTRRAPARWEAGAAGGGAPAPPSLAREPSGLADRPELLRPATRRGLPLRLRRTQNRGARP